MQEQFVNVFLLSLVFETTGVDRARLPIVLLSRLLSIAIGSPESIGRGAFTALSSSAYALGALPVPAYIPVTVAAFAGMIQVAVIVAVVVHLITTGAQGTQQIVKPRSFLSLPLRGLIVSGSRILGDGSSALPWDAGRVMATGDCQRMPASTQARGPVCSEREGLLANPRLAQNGRDGG